ncbi:MAG: glycosyltransferase family 4 protein [Methylococcales bacterium]
MATGNGAHVLHKSLETSISGYRVASYSPWLTLFPPVLKLVGRELKADLIHTTPDYAIFHACRDVPLIITFHGYAIDTLLHPYSSLLQRIHGRTDLRWFTRLAVERANALTAVSHFTANLARRDLGIDRPIRVIHNGIDESRFTPTSTRRSEGAVKVLFCGNLTRRKGAHWILPIAESLDDGIQILYTQGLRTRSVLPEHPRLSCVGNIPYQAMPELYRDVDILLVPTVREGLPMAALEAMACGIPVVASDCSSLPELIDQGKGGFLVRTGDVEAFAERINFLANSSELRREMGQFNRARVEAKFTRQQMVAAYDVLFSELLDYQGAFP